MNNYIINPWWFYFLNVCDGLRILFLMIGIMSLICLFCCLVGISMGMEYTIKVKKIIKITIIIGMFFTILGIIVPSYNTLKEMIITNLLTKDNINLTIEEIKELIEYIVNVVEGTK